MKSTHVCTLILLVALVGCQDSNKPKADLPNLHPAKGKVVRGGQAVSGGSIRLEAEPPTPDIIVSAEVKSDGSFDLQTVHALSGKSAPGAPPGTYKATFTPAFADQIGGGANPIPVTPNQTYTIQAGQNDLTIEVGKK
jgi:hypothetical protein